MKKIISGTITLSLLLISPAAMASSHYSMETHGQKSMERKVNWTHGVFYEIYVNSFYDSNHDGHGDLEGIIEKLDYLKKLGVDGLWLMPINPSPSYHKYDVVDYYNVDPQYGTLNDFHKLTQEAHKRGMKVTIDLVLNHTSSEHPWFKSASTDLNSPYRDYYVWANDKTDLNEKGAWGQQVWYKNPKGDGYFYSTFWSGMPDLNYDNPKVREEMIKVGKFWLKKGADGFRLDAAMHIYPGQTKEGANKNYEWWNEFRTEMKKIKPDVILTGEVWNDTPVIAPYYKVLTSCFDFPLEDKVMNSVRTGSDQGVALYAQQANELYKEYDKNAIDSPFLTNHDQNRVMSVLGGDVNKAKIAASILLTLPGNPYIYYGEEIGMKGEKPDEYIREPFPWYASGTGRGETTWETPKYNTDYTSYSEEAEWKDKNSILNHYREMIRLRHKHDALMNGDLHALDVNDKRVIVFKRSSDKETVILLHNNSNEPVTLHLDDKLFGNMNINFSTSEQVEMKDKVLIVPPYTTVLMK